MHRTLYAYFLWILGVAAARPALASQEALTTTNLPSYKYHFWSIGITGERYSYKAGDGYEFLGNSGAVSIGYGYMKDRWFWHGSGDFIVGPFNPSSRRSVDVNFEGSGVNLWWGYSAQELELRHPANGYGFTFGLIYQDVVGRSIEDNKFILPKNKQSPTESRHLYRVGVNALTFAPGIFFCWMQPARTAGASLEQLKTRIEGYVLSLAFAMPYFANYNVSYQQWQKDEVRSAESFSVSPAHDEGEWKLTRQKQKGKLEGFSILITLKALLGT